MRTKRKNYRYDSSDYDNGDYDQEDFEGDDDDYGEEDQVDESGGDSDYDEYGNENGKKNQSAKSKGSKSRNSKQQDEDLEDTYEDEDPFSPEIDQILADNNMSQQQPQVQNWYLVKFTDQSYLHVKWMEESQLEEYSYRAKQKIRRYYNAKEKKRLIVNLSQSQQFQQEQLQRTAITTKPQKNHHFSDDEEEEEEDEDAAIKGIPLPIIPMASDDVIDQEASKPTFIKVEGEDGEDLTTYFDKNYIAVERVLSTTLLFPIIHPRQAKQIRGKWQDDCLKVVNVLANFRKNNVPIGLAFCEQLDTDNEDLQDYFKVVKQPIDFVMIMNRLYNRMYQQPQEFWNDLGLVFKNCRTYYKSIKRGLRKQCDALRCLAYHLYNDWYQEQKNRFVTGVALPPQQEIQQQNQIQQNQTAQLNTNQDQNVIQQTNVQTSGEPQKDPTIVNLQSLLRTQQNSQEQQKKAQLGSQQQEQFQPQNQSASSQMQDSTQQTSANQFNQPISQLPNPLQQQIPQQMQQDMWNINNLQAQMGEVPNFQQPQSTPNLPSLNQIMNPVTQNANQPSQSQFLNLPKEMSSLMDQMQMQQQFQQRMNQGIVPSQSPMLQNPQQMGNQSQNQETVQPQQQMDWTQENIMKQMQGGQTNQPDISNTLQLPSINQIQQRMMQGQQQNDQHQQMMEMNWFQALQQQQEKNKYLNQMMNQGMNLNNMTQSDLQMLQLMGQDLNQFGMRQPQLGPGQLPSLQLPGFNQQFNQGFGLPSMNQFGTSNLSSQMNTLDPYNMTLMNMMSGPNTLYNPMMQQPQNMFKMPGYQSQMSTGNPYDEMSMMLGSFQPQIPGAIPNLNPYGQQDLLQQNQGALMGYNNQYLNQMGMMNPNMMQNQMRTMQNQQFQMPNQLQPITNIDPNLIQPDNLDQYNDKQQDPPVPPCIIDPGNYDLSWILEPNETLEDLQTSPYLSQDEIDQAVKSKNNVDQLYLIKWKSLSYQQSTWEPESYIKGIYDDKVQDFNNFNRSLDQFQRDRLDQLIKNHKKMLRVTEKKYTGKRTDPNQEAWISMQEAKINRQLLNEKIQEIMGQAFYSFIQYNEKNGLVPQFKKPTQRLKDYQLVGLNWLIRAWHEHRNVVLADEMGLGKTIMTLSLFDHLNKVYKLRGPYLILAPLTTLEHWKKIADEWTTLNSVLYYDPASADGRSEIRYWEWFYNDVTYKGQITQKSELYKFNIIITSFEVFMQDLNPILQEIPFIYIVVDEAHRLKNKQAKTLKLLKDHPCKRILLLTGTPVQNNTKELWTLLNYIEPAKFNSLDSFLEEYGNLETYEQIQKLHTILKPHFLRRLKEEVDNSIPPLQETVIEVGLTTLQSTYYKGIYGENRMMLAKFGTNSIKTSQLNNIDVQLRKCCNHLFLLKGVEEELTRECKTEEDVYRKLLESSGKLMLLDKFIEKFKQENHKMLIFSQFKRMLDIIEFYLKMKAVPYEKLTGSVKTQDRINAIQRFNDDKSFGVFLLTTRAGGLGINLTSARVVIIFDSDWNPQNDLQAIARAHRIGQKFEVQVYRLITSKTYEEQMFERASKKLGMEQALFSKGAFHQNDLELSSLHLRGLTELKQDSKEIENLLKYGAYAFIDGEGGEDDQVNKDIDEILATGKKKEFTYSKGLYTLQKSTFNASKYENLPDVNDPDFWDKVLPFESIISISVLEKRFKKEKKEMGKNEKLQKEFIKDMEIVFNDFMDAKFDQRTSAASKQQFESDEEKLREILKKMIKLTGMKLIYVEQCKEWLRDMLRPNKRKKPVQIRSHQSGDGQMVDVGDEDDQQVEEDDIILYDSDDQIRNRTLRKRNPPPPQQQPRLENEDGQPILRKRGRKPKNQTLTQQNQSASKSQEDSENFGEDEEDIYGDEEDKDYQFNEGRQQRKQRYDELYFDSDDEPEVRYGLRANRKRQKTSRDENLSSSQQIQNLNSQSKTGFKYNEQLLKRNEKNGIVCAYCLHPETPGNVCTYFCTGYCQRFFHEECRETLFQTSESRRFSNRSQLGWQCDDCLDNRAACFCCKQKGQILLFPKKGKPKAAGFSDQQQPSFILEDEEFPEDNLSMEQPVENVNKVEDEIEAPKDETVKPEEEIKEQKDENNLEQSQQQQLDQQPAIEEKVEEEEVPQQTEEQDKQNEMQTDAKQQDEANGAKENEEEIPQIQKDTSTKIVLSNIGPLIKKISTDPMSNDSKIPLQKNYASGLSSPEPEPNDKRFVVRCTLGGCFKYYHVDCVYKNKNVSCINSMKVQRFRCPLHYCEICQASGDSVLIVQCVTCPTAYHLKCLPQDAKAIRLTKKYIICGKHNMSPEDFPKYEEKSASQLYSRQMHGSGQGLKTDKKKKRTKKRGRKPKSGGNAYDDEEIDELEPVDEQIDIQQQNTLLPQNLQTKKELFSQRQPSNVVIKLSDDTKKILNERESPSSSIKNEPQVPKPLFAVIRTNQKVKQDRE